MDLELTPSDVEQIMELRSVMREVLGTEPGTHPELPEMIHRLFKAVITTLVYTLNLSEGIVLEVNQHKLDQEIGETALLKIFTDLGIFGPDTYQKAIVQTTEELGEYDVGEA
jgi:hypothetical protein